MRHREQAVQLPGVCLHESTGESQGSFTVCLFTKSSGKCKVKMSLACFAAVNPDQQV